MNTNFHYNVVPSGQNVSTRVAFQDDLKPDALVAQAAAASGLTAEQITTAGTAIFRQIIAAAKQTSASADSSAS